VWDLEKFRDLIEVSLIGDRRLREREKEREREREREGGDEVGGDDRGRMENGHKQKQRE
jgi:hypothetical protein